MSKLTGSCLCGDIAYAIEGPGESMLHCHCSMCRKHHGSAFQTVVAVASSRFQWLSGQDRLATYESSPGFGRSFCPRCGSTLPPREVSGDPVFVPAGNLDGDPDARPVMHIFTGSKAAWYSIADDLPQHDAYPTGFDGPVLDDPDAGPPQAASCRGSCLCGKVRFRFTGTARAMRNCHCSRCRRSRAAAHATNVFADPAAFEWTAGEDRVRTFDLPGAERFGADFCSDCGSLVPRKSSVAGWNIPAGTLDDDPGRTPDMHIFAADRAAWFSIADALPQFELYP